MINSSGISNREISQVDAGYNYSDVDLEKSSNTICNLTRQFIQNSNTARPISATELWALNEGQLDPLNPSYDKKRILDKYGAEGPNALSKRDENRIQDLSKNSELIESENGKSVIYNFAILMDGRVMVGKFNEGESDEGVKHFHLANGEDTKLTGQVFVRNGQVYVNNNSATFRFMLYQNYRNYYQDEKGQFITVADTANQDLLKAVFTNILGCPIQIDEEHYYEEDAIDGMITRIENKIQQGEGISDEIKKRYEYLKKWRNSIKALHHLDDTEAGWLSEKDRNDLH